MFELKTIQLTKKLN